MDEDIRTYEIISGSRSLPNRFRVAVPASWKVTYGPILGSKGALTSVGMTLRFYENDTKQRALFTDVISFRDTSIGLLRYAKHRPGSNEWFDPRNTMGPDLGRNVEYGWVPEDDIINLAEGPVNDESDDADVATPAYLAKRYGR